MNNVCKISLAKSLEKAIFNKGISDLKVISILHNTKKNYS